MVARFQQRTLVAELAGLAEKDTPMSAELDIMVAVVLVALVETGEQMAQS